jgi:hypothetical protein
MISGLLLGQAHVDPALSRDGVPVAQLAAIAELASACLQKDPEQRCGSAPSTVRHCLYCVGPYGVQCLYCTVLLLLSRSLCSAVSVRNFITE